VSLVDVDGKPVNSTSSLLQGILTEEINTNLSAQFSIKVLETSEGTMFRLCFIVKYETDVHGPRVETILSRPFTVYSNKRKTVKERPLIIDMRPAFGPASTECEVWIKGRGFTENVVVSFGNKLAKVAETSENLITVLVPPRPDLDADTTVPVSVSNKYSKGNLCGEKQLQYSYKTKVG